MKKVLILISAWMKRGQDFKKGDLMCLVQIQINHACSEIMMPQTPVLMNHQHQIEETLNQIRLSKRKGEEKRAVKIRKNKSPFR